MNTKTQIRTIAAALCILTLSACADSFNEDMTYEFYTRNFIKQFGLMDPEQDWNMATQAIVRLNLGDQNCTKVKIYCKQGSKYYLIADLNDVSGRLDVPVDVPKSSRDVLVKANDRKFYGKIGSLIDCTVASRGVPSGDLYPEDDNSNAAIYEDTKEGFHVKVQHTTRGNGEGLGFTDNHEYQYFNTQQVSAIVSPNVWEQYYSLNTKSYSTANDGSIGLLPESGVFNRTMDDISNWITEKRREGQELVEDFKIHTGSDGSFTLFPFYYGTNLEHELGVYLLNDDGDPILTGNRTFYKNRNYSLSDFVYFPVFHDREHGDLQVQPHFDSAITEIRVWDSSQNKTPDFLDLEKGEVFDLQALVQVKRNGEWIDYNTYKAGVGKNYHSRIAYHLWVDRPKSHNIADKPKVYATVSKDGKITAKEITAGHDENNNNGGRAYGLVSIATGMNQVDGNGSGTAGQGQVIGVSTSISYRVVNAVTTDITRIEIEELDGNNELHLTAGETIPLTINLYVGDTKVDFDSHFSELKVTNGWGGNVYEIWKDENQKKIYLQAKGVGSEYPKVYIGKDYDHYLVKNDFKVVVSTAPTTVNHTYTATYTSYPSSLTPTWKSLDTDGSYFVTKEVTSDDSQVLRAYIYYKSGTHNLPASIYDEFIGDYGAINETVGSDKITDKILEYFQDNYTNDTDHTQAYTNFTAWYSSHSSDVTVVSGPTTISGKYRATKLCSDTNGNNNVLDNYSHNSYYTELYLFLEPVDAGSSSSDPETYIDWRDGAKTAMASALTTYFNNPDNYPSGSVSCSSHSDETISFTGTGITVGTPTVTIANDADYNTVKYTVSWTISELQSSTSAPARRRANSGSRATSTSDDRPELLKDNGNWLDVSSYWTRYLPSGEEVASYPSDMTMLARSRGYDITIYYDADGDGIEEPWVGNLGMYLKVYGSHDLQNEGDENGNHSGTGAYTTSSPYPYTVFSQRKFNRDKNGDPYQQISALSVKHPVTGRTFLTFEDMLVTHPEYSGDSPYDFWEESSDRDVNDLVFNIANYGSISNDDGHEIKDEETVDEGFPWIWAVEDLGSTDDFDFNDLVVKITSVTTTNKRTETIGEGDDAETTTSFEVLSKKITFTPLAAGGVLPLYIHLVVGENEYVLRPGVFDITTGNKHSALTSYTGEDLIQKNSSEVHAWFANGLPHTTMINTGSGGGVSTTRLNSCDLYVDAPTCNPANGQLNNNGFRINAFKDVNGNTVDNSKVKGNVRFFVTVRGTRTQGNIGDNRLDNIANEEGWTIENRELGFAPQSFIIKGDTWRWPKERKHILDAYPDFKDWVKDASNDTWMNNPVESLVY